MKNTLTDVIIEARSLTKQFGKLKALDGFNLQVQAGEVHGFLGPNGSGKSTTVRILLGLMKKTSGEVRLYGQDPWKQAVDLHKRLAYVPGEVSFWPNLTGGEIIDLLGCLRGGLDETRRQELIAKFELDPRKKFKTYSKGNRQKVALIAALASDVELYIFDEPTSGLDPLMESLFQDEVRGLKRRGKTILLSSHILSEVESLCDRVTIIRRGRTVEAASLDELRQKHRAVMVVKTNDDLSQLANTDGVYNFKVTSDGAKFELDSAQTSQVLKQLSNYDISHLSSHPPALEDLFLRHYDDSSTEVK